MDNQPFAYTILSSPYLKELKTMYWGGIIESFIACEEQWVEPEDLWPFNWGKFMYRNSVVQLTKGWDPRLDLLTLFKNNNIKPFFRQVNDKEKDNIIFFDRIPSHFLSAPSDKSAEFLRFFNIVKTSLSLSQERKLGLLFVGGRGFSLDLELNKEDQSLLKDVGIKFPSRMP